MITLYLQNQKKCMKAAYLMRMTWSYFFFHESVSSIQFLLSENHTRSACPPPHSWTQKIFLHKKKVITQVCNFSPGSTRGSKKKPGVSSPSLKKNILERWMTAVNVSITSSSSPELKHSSVSTYFFWSYAAEKKTRGKKTSKKESLLNHFF